MNSFIIVTPIYIHNSNGIKTMHKICHTINELGGDARIFFINSTKPDSQELAFGERKCTNLQWNTPVLAPEDVRLIKQAYVIYPETIIGNPLDSKKVIRYFGNREGHCNNKPINIQPTDFLMAHSRKARENAHYILFNAEINPAFHSRDSRPTPERTLDLTYVGKGYMYGKTEIISNTLHLSRLWPESQEQVALLMRQTRYFYTWDSWTSINVEAVLCGAVPIILRYDPWTKEDVDGSELPFPHLDIQNTTLDYDQFLAGKQELERRLKEISHTWDSNVRGFMEAVEKHFEK